MTELREGGGLGKPETEDWDSVSSVTTLLKAFYDLTLRVSGSYYVTANTYFNEISNVDMLLRDWSICTDKGFASMSLKMREKCEKYWGDPEKMNLMIFIAVVLDPISKMEYLEFAVVKMYGKNIGDKLIAKVKVTLKQLFDEYKSTYSTPNNQPSKSDESGSSNIIDLEDQ